MNRDILQLKLQRKLIEDSLTITDSKLHRLSDILDKKAKLHPSDSKPDELAVTRFGSTVSELRAPSSSSLPKIVNNNDITFAVPSPVSSKRILGIRTRHVIKNEGVSIVNATLRRKEEKLRRIELHNKGPTYPKIPIPESMLPNRYIRGELPCTIEHGGANGKYLSWACPLEKLDYEFYLPLFFDGLQCKDKIITFIACQGNLSSHQHPSCLCLKYILLLMPFFIALSVGIEDMLYASRGSPERIKPVVPMLVRPLRNAFAKYDKEVVLWCLKAIQQLVTCNEGVGEVFMPYCKQFLAPLALFLDQTKNIGDSIDYGQRKRDDVGEEVGHLDAP